MFVIFPELYPVQPIFRFVSALYHLNVSSDGNIYLNIINNDYISSMHVVDITQEIKELFILSNLYTQVQIEIYVMFKNNSIQYEKLARKSTKRNAKYNIEYYIGSSIVLVEVPNDFKLDFNQEENVPFDMRSDKPKEENIVLASSSVYYDKDEFIQLLASSEKPIWAVTGKVLTEKLHSDD